MRGQSQELGLAQDRRREPRRQGWRVEAAASAMDRAEATATARPAVARARVRGRRLHRQGRGRLWRRSTERSRSRFLLLWRMLVVRYSSSAVIMSF